MNKILLIIAGIVSIVGILILAFIGKSSVAVAPELGLAAVATVLFIWGRL